MTETFPALEFSWHQSACPLSLYPTKIPTWLELLPGTAINPKSPGCSSATDICVIPEVIVPVDAPILTSVTLQMIYCTNPEQSKPFLSLPI